MLEAFVGVFLFFSIERAMATFAWSWYEKESALTLVAFVLLEGCAQLWSLTWSIALVLEYITTKALMIGFACTATIGITIGLVVIAVNFRATMKMKVGARVNKYSVARTYQIRENVVILKALFKIAKGACDRVGSLLQHARCFASRATGIIIMVYVMLHTNRTFTDEFYPFFEIIYAIEMRLSLCNLVVQGLIGSTARFIFIYNQYAGEGPLEERPSVIVASLLRCSMMEAFVGAFFLFSVERMVATFAWSWWKSSMKAAKIIDISIQIGISVIAVNWRASVRMKGGAHINGYSVARTFQIRENLVILKVRTDSYAMITN
ncbi:hypothetical protein PRIPAC_80524 [Pristionchus pacificus]|uniref:G protein-coupled receptor n=1 Tax=Pristionchus pacificus TaxID=54126 RepID=A0A2A6CNK3_PRIPA|nr:hypothetical protein PRIPAC_80524 [Pristionchus pacificus]|eukprot:PDM79611.1 G protein-coupled receptor [Pristionchus pacificus]